MEAIISQHKQLLAGIGLAAQGGAAGVSEQSCSVPIKDNDGEHIDDEGSIVGVVNISGV